MGDAAGNLYNGQGVFGNGFYQIDRTTGAGSLLGDASYPSGTPYANLTALAFTDGTMYAISQVGSIYMMNLTNGASTQISTYNTGIAGSIEAAAAPITAAPEASTLTIGSLAGLMVAACG